jgi:hypothetical protein
MNDHDVSKKACWVLVGSSQTLVFHLPILGHGFSFGKVEKTLSIWYW